MCFRKMAMEGRYIFHVLYFFDDFSRVALKVHSLSHLAVVLRTACVLSHFLLTSFDVTNK